MHGLAKSWNSGRRHCTVASGSGPRGARWTDAHNGAGTQMMQREDAFETRARVVHVVSFVDEDVCDAFLKGFSKSADFTVRWLASAFSYLIFLLEPAVWASGFCWDTAAAAAPLSLRCFSKSAATEGSSDMLSNSVAWLSEEYLRLVLKHRKHSLPFGRSLPVLSFQTLCHAKWSGGRKSEYLVCRRI